jgi:NTP pyrophosphatase (non-canonical NTP hydrolase)
MNPHDQMMEALGILQEECDETIVVSSKIRRFGIDTEYLSGQGTKRENLTQELGDILAMVAVLVKQGVLDQELLEAAARSKIEKLKKYSTLQNLNDILF